MATFGGTYSRDWLRAKVRPEGTGLSESNATTQADIGLDVVTDPNPRSEPHKHHTPLIPHSRTTVTFYTNTMTHTPVVEYFPPGHNFAQQPYPRQRHRQELLVRVSPQQTSAQVPPKLVLGVVGFSSCRGYGPGGHRGRSVWGSRPEPSTKGLRGVLYDSLRAVQKSRPWEVVNFF